MNETKTFSFRCCFCNQKIQSSKVDPSDVNVLINLDKDKELQYNQSFYCHATCFREKLHNNIKIHFHLHNILDD